MRTTLTRALKPERLRRTTFATKSEGSMPVSRGPGSIPASGRTFLSISSRRRKRSLLPPRSEASLSKAPDRLEVTRDVRLVLVRRVLDHSGVDVSRPEAASRLAVRPVARPATPEVAVEVPVAHRNHLPACPLVGEAVVAAVAPTTRTTPPAVGTQLPTPGRAIASRPVVGGQP